MLAEISKIGDAIGRRRSYAAINTPKSIDNFAFELHFGFENLHVGDKSLIGIGIYKVLAIHNNQIYITPVDLQI